MKVAMFPNSSGSRYWRLEDPAKYLNKLGIETRVVLDQGITDEIAQWADVYVLQGCVDKVGIATLHAYQKLHGKGLVVDMDDSIHPDASNPYAKEHEIYGYAEVVKKTIEIADLVTTTTDFLADKLRELNQNVAVLPNFMDLERWDLPKLKNDSKKVRIGWAGSITHIEDLKLLVDPLTKICHEFPQVQLIFIGDVRTKELFKGLTIEAMDSVHFDAWPARLNGLRLDIGLAPLVDNEFNQCKSNIKWMEYAIAGVPGVFSPTVYHHRSFEPQYGLIAYNSEQWYQCIKNLILNENLRKDIAFSAHEHVKRNYSLEKKITKWKEAYESIFH